MRVPALSRLWNLLRQNFPCPCLRVFPLSRSLVPLFPRESSKNFDTLLRASLGMYILAQNFHDRFNNESLRDITDQVVEFFRNFLISLYMNMTNV